MVEDVEDKLGRGLYAALYVVGGALARDDPCWRAPDALYLTKGDGDRDWPTLFDLERLGLVA